MPSSSSAGPAPTLCWWNPTALPVAQVVTITITGAAPGAVVTVAVGAGVFAASISYTLTGADTNATAAAALQALLAASTDPRFQEITFAAAVGNVITCTAVTAGVPFTPSGSAT